MPLKKDTEEQVIRKHLNISPDVPLDQKLPKNFIMNKYANYAMVRDTLPMGHKGYLDSWFEKQGIDLLTSAPAPQKDEGDTKGVIKSKKVWGDTKIQINADPFFALARMIIRGRADHLNGRKGINFIFGDIIGSEKPSEYWAEVLNQKKGINGKLQNRPDEGEKTGVGLPTEETSGAGSEGELQEDVREGESGSGAEVGRESKE